MGRFELKVSGRKPVASTDETESSVVEFKIDVVAEAVPLAAFAVRFASETGIAISVDPEIAAVPVTVVARAATLDEIRRLVSGTHPIEFWWEREGSRLLFYSPRTSYERNRSVRSEEYLSVQIVPLHSAVHGRQLATMLCEQVLSSRGSISIVGSVFVVREVASNLGRVRAGVVAIEDAVLNPDGGGSADGGS